MTDPTAAGLSGPRAPAQPPNPSLTGSTVRLRPLRAGDVDLLYELATGEGTGWRSRYRGTTPDPARFAEALHHAVLVQHLAEDRRTGRPLGHLVAYNADLRNGHAWLAVTMLPDAQRTRATGEAVVLFVDYLFTLWDLHKLYVESPEYNLHQFGSLLGRHLVEEGRYREHEVLAGRRWDLVTAALYRSTWIELRPRALRLIQPPDPGPPG